ncbi:D-amino acid dehydrogenase [Crenalkalicoccus roseus]|uniref:D-amino acid dehydrogenase n=1 Tax=Crenalkalicoccus roseus TaxID=1485588 RepID=UPI0010812381|nr:D-amino acid dehydrogenase [Crenalkalicoccus roseus]
MRVAVLGAGVIGVTTAWYLAREGHDVTVVERNAEPARGTSFANAGLVAPGHSLTWASPKAPRVLLRSLFLPDQALRLRLRADPRMWAWCFRFLRNCTAKRARINTLRKLALCVYSQRELRTLVAETGLRYDGLRHGLLYLYRDAASLERGVAAMAVLRDEGGQRMEVVDAARAAEIEPALGAGGAARIAGGIYCPDDESGDARAFTEALAALCQDRAGVRFRYNETVLGAEVEGDRVHAMVTDHGRVEADAFVLALGTHSPTLGRKLGLRLPVYPVKGYSVTIPVEGHNGAPDVGGVDENNLVAWCRMGDRFRLTATAEFAGFDTSHRPSDFAAMLRVGRELFPEAGNWGQPSYWAGLRPMTPEGTPILGRGRHRNLWINTGHGHMGWTMACGSAHITADLIAGRRPAVSTDGMMYCAAG